MLAILLVPIGPNQAFHLCACFCSVDPFSKKEWYDIKAPGAFTVRNVGKTLVTRTAGTKVRRAGGRVIAMLNVAWTLQHTVGARI